MNPQHRDDLRVETKETEVTAAPKEKSTSGIDWDIVQQAVEAAVAADKVQPLSDPEIDAMVNEGLAPMPVDVQLLRQEKLKLDEMIDQLNARKSDIKEEVARQLDELGLAGFVLNGKVRARVSHGTRTGVDGKKLKEKHPAIWKRFLKTTEYRSITIS